MGLEKEKSYCVKHTSSLSSHEPKVVKSIKTKLKRDMENVYEKL